MNAPSPEIDASQGPDATPLQVYVFYHEQAQLLRALKGRSPESFGTSFAWINLNTLPLPPEAVIPGVEPALNRAMLSEYLGILSVQPPQKVAMVGTFTYSIPLKFSLAWALETGRDNVFLPEVDFTAIEALLPELLPHALYGVEFKHPLAADRGPVRLLAEQQGGVDPEARGPYKGTLICSRERFLELQAYLRRALPTILGFDEQHLAGVTNPFSSSALAGRAPERAALDQPRSTYGNALERAMALCFSGNEHRPLQIRLGDLVRQQQVSSCPMLQAAHAAAWDGTLVLSFCNAAYLPVLQRWLGLARQAEIRGLLVVSFDAATCQFCQEQGVATAPAEMNFPADLGELWRYRLELTRRFVHSGLSVLLSDLDAYWLADPIPRLRHGQAHIVASQGTVHPRDVFEQTGLVLCCGFIYFRSSAPTLDALNQLSQVVVSDQDDQRVLNRWLLQQGLRWQIPPSLGRSSHAIAGRDLAFTGYDGDLEGETSGGLRVRLLAHRDFQRVLDPRVRPIVSHLHMPKRSAAKLDAHELLVHYPEAPAQGAAQ